MEELDEVPGAVAAAEVLSAICGFPIDFLDEDSTVWVALSAPYDVVEEAAVHGSKVAGFEEVTDDSGVDGGFGGGAEEGEVVGRPFFVDDRAIFGECVLCCNAHGGDNGIGYMGGVLGKERN